MQNAEGDLVSRMKRLGFDAVLIKEMQRYASGEFEPGREPYLRQLAAFLEEILDEHAFEPGKRKPQP